MASGEALIVSGIHLRPSKRMFDDILEAEGYLDSRLCILSTLDLPIAITWLNRLLNSPTPVALPLNHPLRRGETTWGKIRTWGNRNEAGIAGSSHQSCRQTTKFAISPGSNCLGKAVSKLASSVKIPDSRDVLERESCPLWHGVSED